MSEPIKSIETFFFEAPREELYLGPLGPGDIVTPAGYIVRGFSTTVYPAADRSVVVRVETESGIVGWGETSGLVLPEVIAEMLHGLVFDFVRGRDATRPEEIHDFLYALMRVRGYSGGFWLDALAGLDIALWDIKAKSEGRSLAALIGGSADREIGAYISGLPGAALRERVALAAKLVGEGYDRFKIKLESFIHTDDQVRGVRDEMAALRGEIGAGPEISIDMHWLDGVERVLEICAAVEPHRPWFVEAPCQPEEIENLAAVCAGTRIPVAIGEEWRTVFDARLRAGRGISIMQPEMGHTGITEFLRIAGLARTHGIELMPHATVGMGIFLCASLQASAGLGVGWHEYQHSVMGRNREFIDGGFSVAAGRYRLAGGDGIGVEPSAEGLKRLTPMRKST
jgi:galactonate dehydratase